MARIEQNRFTGEVEKTSFKEIFETVFQIVQAKADEKQILLKYRIDENLPPETNLNLLEQALVNLVDNAVKYSSEGTRIDLSAKIDDGILLINVIDQGQGIPEKHLHRIFERFYRVDKARSRKLGGTGLGLAIVKHIIQAHGGDISVKSEVAKGSSFNIRLPLS